MKIQLSTEFIILISGIFLGIFGLCVPAMPWGATLIIYGVLAVIAAPVMMIVGELNK